MAITNLTGYTWKPNNSVSITSAKTYNIIGNGVSQQGTFETTTFELIRRTQTNEFSGSQEYFVGLYLSGGMFSNFTVGIAYWCNSSSSSSYPSTARTADTEATLTFTGGTDTTNPELIAWLEANGTLEKMFVPITQLAPFLTNIANAIRTKKGTTAQINAQNFASEIESIESCGGGSSFPMYEVYDNSTVVVASCKKIGFVDMNNEYHAYSKGAGGIGNGYTDPIKFTVKTFAFIYNGQFGTIHKCTNLYNLTKGEVATTTNVSSGNVLVLIGNAEFYGGF